MNEEQISQPSDMADEQNPESGAGTNAEMSADASTDAGNGSRNEADNGTEVISSDGGGMAEGGQPEARSETADRAEASTNGLTDQPIETVEIEEASEAVMPEADSSSTGGEDIRAEAPAQAMGEGEPAGEEPLADQPLDNQPSGDEPAGDPAEQPIGEPPTRERPIGEPPMGDQDRGPARFQRQFQDEGSDEAPPELVVRPARDPNMENVASDASMEDLMKASAQQYRTLKHGDVLEGTVMKVDREEILLDIGAKTEGVIPSREATSMSEEERSALKIGDEVLVSVLQPENSEGHAVLSVDRARQERAWRDLHKQYEAGEIIQAQVVGHNKGGLLVNLEGIRGFVPSSQISSMPPGEANKQAELARLHSSTMPLKIIEINRNRNRLILSERQAMQEQRESMRSRLLQELEPGQIRPGTVTSICDFGAFVDIGGADGLIHLSELSWKRVSHPSELLKPGERIDVYVLSVDPNERKIALSLKRTQPEPWDTITDQYQLGQVVHGTITQITSFGAFARLEDGIEGLIHVSELAEGRVAHPRNVVKEGDSMDLKVIRIDPARKRIGLSLKRMIEGAEGGEGGEGTGEETGGEMRAETPGEGAEGAESGYTPPTPSRERQFERGATQEREQRQPRQDRQERPDRPQKAPVSSASFDVPEDDAPSGALAAALAAHAQRGRAAQETESDEAADTEGTPKQTDVLTDPGSEADITDTLGETADTGTDEGNTEADSAEAPEAMMPSAADTDEATAASEDMPAESPEESTESDSGAASGSEAMPSTADSADEDTSAAADTTTEEASEDEDTAAGTDEVSDDTQMAASPEEIAVDATSDTTDNTDGAENSDAGNYAENAAEAATDSQSDPEEMSSVAGSEEMGEEKEDKTEA